MDLTSQIIQLRDEQHMSFRAIARYLGIGRGAAYNRYAHRRIPKRKPKLLPIFEPCTRVSVPDDVIAERDRRKDRAWSFNIDMLGDPEPGRSALDQRGIA